MIDSVFIGTKGAFVFTSLVGVKVIFSDQFIWEILLFHPFFWIVVRVFVALGIA